MKYNYHTHTFRCFHARGTDEEYVKAAIKAGFDEIGFSDHSPWNFDGYVSNMRMHESELEEYCNSVKSLRKKYKDQISIKLGLECEYFPKYLPWLKEMTEKHSIDYLILGHHFSTDEIGGKYNGALTDKKELYTYRDDILEAIETGLFSYIAHPDIFMRGYPVFDESCEEISRQIIQKAIETKTPLEFNLLGFSHSQNDGKQGYPHPDFWKIAGEMKPLVTVGVDAHEPEAYLDTKLFESGYEALRKLGLHAVDSIKMLR